MNLKQQYAAKLESKESYIDATDRTILQLQKTKEIFISQTDKSIEVIKAEAMRQLEWIDEDLRVLNATIEQLNATIGHVPPVQELKVA